MLGESDTDGRDDVVRTTPLGEELWLGAPPDDGESLREGEADSDGAVLGEELWLGALDIVGARDVVGVELGA